MTGDPPISADSKAGDGSAQHWIALEALQPPAPRPDLVFWQTPLSPDRLSGNGQRLDGSGDGAQLLIQARAAWELSLIVDIADHAIAGCSTIAVLTLDGADQAVDFGLVGGDGELAAGVRIPAGPRLVQAYAGGMEGFVARAVALQAGPVPSRQPLRLHALHLGYRLRELEAAWRLGPGSLTPARALERLLDGLTNVVIGAPADADARPAEPIDFRSPQCFYRFDAVDGPYRDGARRSLRMGLTPWAYVAQIPVPRDQVVGARWLRVDLAQVGASMFIQLVDAGLETVITQRVAVREGAQSAQVWIDVAQLADDCVLVLQSGEAPNDGVVVLCGVHAVR